MTLPIGFKRSEILVRQEDFGWIIALPNADIDFYEDAVSDLINVPPQDILRADALDQHRLRSLKIDHKHFFLRAPLVVSIEITRRCNLPCIHCYLSAGAARDTELSEGELRRLILQLCEMGVFCIQFTGGEPLLCSYTVDLIREAHSLGLVTALSTNGLLLTPEIIARLPKKNFSVGLSLDGIGAGECIRGSKADFETLTRKIILLRDAGITLDVMLTLNRLNLNDAPAVIAWCQENDVFLEILDIQPFGRAKLHPEIIPCIDDVEKDLLVYTLKEELEDSFEKRHGPREELIYPGFINMCYWINMMTRRCKGGRSMAYIASDGHVFPCSNCASEEILSPGTITSIPFPEIWRELHWPIRSIVWGDFNECEDCELASPPYYCCGRCPALSHAKFDGNLLRCGASRYTKTMIRSRTHMHMQMHTRMTHRQINPARVTISK